MTHSLISIVLFAIAQQPATPRIITLGDSITRGVNYVKADQTFAYQLQQALTKAGAKVEVVNLGVGGERTDQALGRMQKIIDLKPDIVTIMYGANDSWVDKGKKDARISEAEFGANLKELVVRLRKESITPILMTSPRLGDKHGPNGAGEHPNGRLERLIVICRAVAKELKVPLVDHFAHWDASNKNSDIGAWTTDQVHANERGNQEIAKLMLPVVRKALGK